MIIKYKEFASYFITQCPFKTLGGFFNSKRYVGGIACKENCKHYKFKIPFIKVIVCSHKKEKEKNKNE